MDNGKYLCISTPVSRPSIFAGAVGFYTGEFMVEYLAEDRNRFVATLATNILVAYAGPGSKTAQLCGELVAQHRRAYTLALPENAHLVQCGVLSHALHDLIGRLRTAQGDYSAHSARDETLAPRR